MTYRELARAFVRLRAEYHLLRRRHRAEMDAVERAYQELAADLKKLQHSNAEAWKMLHWIHQFDVAYRAERDDDGVPLQ
jgi:hypothetical protein